MEHIHTTRDACTTTPRVTPTVQTPTVQAPTLQLYKHRRHAAAGGGVQRHTRTAVRYARSALTAVRVRVPVPVRIHSTRYLLSILQ